MARWRELIGDIPASATLRIRSQKTRGSEEREKDPLEAELRGPDSLEKQELAREIADLQGVIPIGLLYRNPDAPCYEDFTTVGMGMSAQDKIDALVQVYSDRKQHYLNAAQ